MSRSQRLWRELTVFGLTALASCLALLWFAGCSNHSQSDQQVQRQAAQATEQVKAEAKQAAADAKVAAANAEREVNDVAAGVKEGMHSNTSPNSANSSALDINSASESSLTTLPGITPSRARRIISNRPYAVPRDLVSKGVLSQAEYDRISGQVIAQ
jgi:DNA uptake protein ComE-like DNA-binding protein